MSCVVGISTEIGKLKKENKRKKGDVRTYKFLLVEKQVKCGFLSAKNSKKSYQT
jgi:hypothetical protein